MNKIKIFSSLILIFIQLPLFHFANAAIETKFPRNCYTDESLNKFDVYNSYNAPDEVIMGTLKYKPIDVIVKQTADTATSSTILDASGSKTISGKVRYRWAGNPEDNKPTTKVKTPERGYTTRVKLNVKDEECGNEVDTDITVSGK